MQKITTKKYEDVIRKVLIDDREQERKPYALEQYKEFNPKITHLDYGDYIFIGHNHLKVVFEYKTGADFLSSIQNNHLHNQVYSMVTNEDYTFVIVECEDLMQQMDELYYSTNISMNMSQVDGAVTDFNVVSTVLFAQTRYQAFDIMMRQAGKIINKKPISYKYGKKSTNSALNYLSAIRGIDSQAEIICRTLNLRCLNDLLKLTKEDLTRVNKIGEKKAEKILKEINKGRYYDISKDKEQTKLFN